MLTKRIIPCLDVDKGRVVKGVGFLDLKDAGDPSELAKFYDLQGADELVFLDITASSDDRAIMRTVVESVSEQVFIPLTVGGGIRNIADIRNMLEAGADKVSLNTAVIQTPSLLNESADFFGSQCIVIAIDAKRILPLDLKSSIHDTIDIKYRVNTKTKWEVYSHGGRVRTGIDAVKWADFIAESGAGEILLTSMDKDGRESGYDLDLLQSVSEHSFIPVIASGGAGLLEHMRDAILIGKVDAVLAASIFHFGIFSIDEVKQFMASAGIPVRPPDTTLLV